MNANREATKRLAWGGALVVAAASVALLALGCSEQEKKATAEINTPTAGIAEMTPAATASATAPATIEPSGVEPAVGADSLAPDVAATVEGELTAPGAIVIITAQGSSDVTSMVLADGLGKKYAFAYDAAANLYRVSYRVPIKTAADRVGLSVTATNGANRWKRVWVFVKTRETPELEDGC